MLGGIVMLGTALLAAGEAMDNNDARREEAIQNRRIHEKELEIRRKEINHETARQVIDGFFDLMSRD